jgi:hypothetical protein
VTVIVCAIDSTELSLAPSQDESAMRISSPTLTTGLLFLVAGCVGGADESLPSTERAIVEVTALYDAATDRHLFQTSADTVRAGWTTFRFTNASPMLHFVFLDHLPGDRTSEELLREVSPIFQESMDLVIAGRPEESTEPFSRLPEWFEDLVFRGGPGLTSPGRTSEATLYLEPGNYVLECYVKTADGVFHWNLGMFKDLHVMSDSTDARPPANPTLTVSLTDSGMVVDGEPTAGDHLVAVHFQEREPALLGKDVHVARMTSDTDIDTVVAWMDVFQVEGMVSTAEDPGPALFLGGTHEMPFGNTAYFPVSLEPGDYVWVAEQPVAEPIYQPFTVH